MSTRSNSKIATGLKTVQRSTLVRRVSAASMLLLLATGCKGLPQLFANLSKDSKKVEAQFLVGDGPVLVLVDDPAGQVDWPAANQYLHDELNQRLIKHKATTKVIPRETLENLKRADSRYEKRGAREIGALAGAERVIWIETQNFLADDQLQEASEAALWTITVKVLDAKEAKNRTQVRLWPKSTTGHAISVNMSAATAAQLKSRDQIAEGLANLLAIEVTKLFAEYRVKDFETTK